MPFTGSLAKIGLTPSGSCEFGCVGSGGGDGCGEDCGLCELFWCHLVTRIGWREHKPEVRARVIEACHQPQRRDASEREVGMVGVLHQRAEGPERNARRLGNLQEEWLEAGKAAGQRGPV